MIGNKTQILGLAPNAFTKRAGHSLANTLKWQSLGQSNAALWGALPQRKKSIQTAVSLAPLAASCTCRRQLGPCQHVLALLLMHAETPAAFTETQPDAWTQRQLQQASRLYEPPGANGRSSPPPTSLRVGMVEFGRWLTDIARMGLAALPQQPASFWQSMVHRLIDAQAPAIAHQIRDMAKLPTKDPRWPERYLRQFGRLYLLTQAFARFDTLSADTQADALLAIGQWPLPDLQTSSLTDQWLVLGRYETRQNQRTLLYTWLWGAAQQRIACLRYDSTLAQGPMPLYATGSWQQGALTYLPGSHALFATAAQMAWTTPTAVSPPGDPTIALALAAYTKAISANPWLPFFPILLQAGYVRRRDDQWCLLDAAQDALPLPPAADSNPFRYGWQLCSMSAQRPISLFGLWDGLALQPLSVNTAAGWQDLHVWQGVA